MRARCYWIGGLLLCLALVAITIATYRLTHGESAELYREFTNPPDARVWCLDASADGRIAMTLGEGNSAQVLELDTGVVSNLQLDFPTSVISVALADDGATLVMGSVAGQLLVFDMPTRSRRMALNLCSDRISSIVFASDGKHVFAIGAGKWESFVYRVELATGSVEKIFSRDSDSRPWRAALVLTIARDGSVLVLEATTDVIVWDLRASRERFSCSLGSTNRRRCGALSPDGRQLAIGNYNVAVWDIETGRQIRELPRYPDLGAIGSLAFSSDGKLLVAAINRAMDLPSHICVSRADSESAPIVIPSHKYMTTAMAFVPGTHRLVTGSLDRTVRVWDLDRLRWSQADEQRANHQKSRP